MSIVNYNMHFVIKLNIVGLHNLEFQSSLSVIERFRLRLPNFGMNFLATSPLLSLWRLSVVSLKHFCFVYHIRFYYLYCYKIRHLCNCSLYINININKGYLPLSSSRWPIGILTFTKWKIGVRRCGVVGSTLAFRSTCRGFEHFFASDFNKLRSLA